MSKYDSWRYSDSFKIENNKGFVLLPAIKYDYNGVGYFSNEYEESQLMFWIKLNQLNLELVIVLLFILMEQRVLILFILGFLL